MNHDQHHEDPEQPERTDFRSRSKLVIEQSVAAFSLALEVGERQHQLPPHDPEYDAAGKVAEKFREIGDVLAGLHEDLVRLADDAERPRRETAVSA